MSLIDTLARHLVRRGTSAERKGLTFLGDSSFQLRVALSPGAAMPDAEQLSSEIAYATSAYAYTALHWRAERAAEPPLIVVEQTDSGDEWLPDHPIAVLLDTPRSDVDMGEVLYRTQLYRDVFGSALWVIDRDRQGRPAAITPFPGCDVTVESTHDQIFGRFLVRTASGRREIAREDAIHFRDPSAFGWTSPTSRLDVALSQLDLGHQVDRTVRNYLRRGFFPAGVISYSPEWRPTQDEVDANRSNIEAWHAGPANAGAPLILPGGASYTSSASSLQTLVPGETLNRIEATVASVFGIPAVVLGWLAGLENSPWSNMIEARRQAYEDTAEPNWAKVGRLLTRSLLTPDERRNGLAIRHDTSAVKALQKDREAMARISALNADIWTVNDRRIFTGSDPLPPNDPRGDRIVGLIDFSSFGGADVGSDLGDEGAKGRVDAKADTWHEFDFGAKASERTWVVTLQAGLAVVRNEIVKGVERVMREAAPDAKMDVDRSRADAALSGINKVVADAMLLLHGRVSRLVTSTGSDAVRRLSSRIGVSFDVLQPGLLQFAAEETAFLTTVMGESTAKVVARTVRDALERGDTIAQLTRELSDLPDFSTDRAKLVARTETTRAWNGAQRRSMSEFARETGGGVRKTWLTSGDDRVRDEHTALEGVEVDIDDRFPNGLSEPSEPNCRCTLIYRVITTGETIEEGTP